eukprot:scaffold81114_cov59-Phaeocystis_antarctica.AAC.2
MPLGMSTDAARASGCAFWSAGLLAPLCARLIASTASMVGAVSREKTQDRPEEGNKFFATCARGR